MFPRLTLRCILLLSFAALPLAQTVGEPLPVWRQGGLDIHQISTGRGNSAFMILPDGTLEDADESARITSVHGPFLCE